MIYELKTTTKTCILMLYSYVYGVHTLQYKINKLYNLILVIAP